MTNCEKIAPLISEYVSGTLNSKEILEVQSHIGRCAECAKLAEDLQRLSEALRSIPSRQPSLRFDESLTKKLAQLPKPNRKPRFSFGGLGSVFALAPRGFVRQSLALATAAAVVIGGLVFELNTHSNISSSSDPGLLASCVQQHRIDAAAQPLSDLSAQALTARPDAQDPKSDALSDINDTENL